MGKTMSVDVMIKISPMREVWNELVVKSQYDTHGMKISEMQKSAIVWADHWVSIGTKAAEQNVQPTAFGVGMRARLGYWLVSLGQSLIQNGGG